MSRSTSRAAERLRSTRRRTSAVLLGGGIAVLEDRQDDRTLNLRQAGGWPDRWPLQTRPTGCPARQDPTRRPDDNG
jgi:hypothetical protein